MKAFVVVSYASWIANDFEPHLDPEQWKIIRDYGFDIPSHLEKYDSVAWWMNAQHAARLQRVGVATSLTAPGSGWLPTVDEKLLGRRIYASTLSEFLSLPVGHSVWIKPAEAKIDGFEAGWRTIEEVSSIASEMLLPDDSSVQWTETLLEPNHEYRFHVLDGKILTGSAYLVDGVTYYDGASDIRKEEAFEFGEYAVDALGENQPDAYTLDIAFDNVQGKWVILEGNPAWCSGIYGSDPEKVVRVIEKSCYNNSSSKNFLWVPDAYLRKIAERKVILK